MYGVPQGSGLRAQGSVLGPVLFVLYTTLLSNIIDNHSVNHQLFTDDTQLQISAPLSEVTSRTKELNACTDDIKTWMTKNQLQLNDDKTEALLSPFSSFLKLSTISLPDSVTLGSHSIPFFDSARSLGVILDSNLSIKKHVIKICQTAYFELKHINRSTGFSLRMQPRLLLLPIFSHCLTTATLSPLGLIDWWLMIAYIALFSALLSRLTALTCDAPRVTSFL